MKQSPSSKRRRHRLLSIERCEPRHLLTTLELSPIADNTIYEDYSSGTSNGIGEHLFVGRTGSLASSSARRALVKFDFSAIPAGANIDSVTLQMTVSSSAPGSGSRDVSLFPLSADWGEGPSDAPGPEGYGTASQAGDASWLHRFFPAVNWVNAGGDFDSNAPSATTTVGSPSQYSWSSEQMKVDVATWLADPDMNFGWILLGDEIDDKTARRMSSRENRNESERPKLVVEYSATTITGPVGSTNSDPFDVTIDFGESVSGFEIQDISVTGGSVEQLVDNGNGVFLASIHPNSDGPVMVEVPAGVAVDSGGAANAEAIPYSVVVDLTSPKPAIDGPASPWLAERFEVSIDFGEIVNGFQLSDISPMNGTVEQLEHEGGGLYTATILGNIGSTVSINVDAGIANDSAGNANMAADPFSVQIPEPTFDFGDAPSTYPVTESANAARHRLGDLFLGLSVDAEFDGNPSTLADGDQDDEDGVFAITSLLASSESTVASLRVIASQTGRLNGWIDFNQDGDWNDFGEQIATGVALVAGPNLVPVAIPGGAQLGDTYARFRLSTDANLSPGGVASDGEVEDYLFRVSDATGAIVAIEMYDPQLEVEVDQEEIIIRAAAGELFRGPAGVDSLEVSGTNSDDRVTIDLSSFSIPTNGLLLDGANGANSLVILGDENAIDFTRNGVEVSRFGLIDLSGDDATRITLNSEVVTMLQPDDSRLELSLNFGDSVTIDPVDPWRMIAPIVVDGEFRLVAGDQTGVERIEASTSQPWHHFFRPNDINNNGEVTAVDALVIINELARQAFSDTNGLLVDPLSVTLWPGIYYDQNGDGRVSALDALRVINTLNREDSGGEGETVFTVGQAAPSEVILEQEEFWQDLALGIERLQSKISGIGDYSLPSSQTNSLRIIEDLLERAVGPDSVEAVDQLLSDSATWWRN